MQILTPTGYRDISACNVGDEVSAFDVVTGAPIINTIDTLQWVDAETFRDWQNPTFLIDGQEHFGLHSLYVLCPPKNSPQPVKVRDLAVGNEVFRIEGGSYVFDYEIASIDQVDPYPAFQFFKINNTWTLNSEQSIWRNGGNVCHAKHLVVGDVIFDDADHDVTITNIEEVPADGWWRFDISGDHSYIVDGLTLHNASRFWVLGTDSWTAVNTAPWSASSGGAGGQSVPGSGDTVTLDASSGGGTVTVNTTVNVTSITGGAHTGTLTFATNNNNVTVSTFSYTGSGVRTLSLGNGTWTITGTSNPWNIITTTNLTFNANSSVLNFTGSTTATRALSGNLTYSTISVAANTSGGVFLFNTAATVGTFTATGPNYIAFSTGTTTITTLTVSGSSGSEVALASATVGTTATVSVAANAPTITWASIRDLTCSGGATFVASDSFDLGHNTGITINVPGGTGSSITSAGVIGS